MKQRSLFQERLDDLLKGSGYSITKFAEELGLTRQTLGFYLNGNRVPDIKKLQQICDRLWERCGVKCSADWLIGRPGAVKSADPELRAICEYTGLSEEAVNSLHSCAESGALDQLSAFLAFLGNDGVKKLNGYLTGAIKRAKPVDNYTRSKVFNAYGLLLSPELTRRYYEDRALDTVREYIVAERDGIGEQEEPDVYEIFGPPYPKTNAGQEEG